MFLFIEFSVDKDIIACLMMFKLGYFYRITLILFVTRVKKMKRFIFNVISILIICCFFVMSSCLPKKTTLVNNEIQKLAFSNKIITGKLENGLTYYVVKNKFPEKKIEFRLNVRTGSLNESEEERGVAHFVEHMAFNGIKHFKHNELISFMEEAGLTFGKHSNAYTSTNVTDYQLTIPSDRKDLVKKAYIIMADWAGGLLFNPDEINKEKGVIIEEWRMRKSAGSRMRTKFNKVLLENSRYPERDAIGKMHIIKNADKKLLKGYYDEWYTPENISVIVVGDVDIEETIKDIKTTFAPIKKKVAGKKEDDTIPYIEGLRVVSISDPEFTGLRCGFDFLWQDTKIATFNDFEKRVYKTTSLAMFRKRLGIKISEKKLPMLRAFAVVKDLVPGTDIGRFVFIPAKKQVRRGFEALFTEMERVKKFGFTSIELEQYKKEVLKSLKEKAMPEKRFESEDLAKEIVDYDIEPDYLLDPQTELELYEKIFATITIDKVNTAFSDILSSKSKIASVFMSESDESLAISRQEIEHLMRKSSLKSLRPYVFEKPREDFMDKAPKGGEIISSSRIASVGATVYTLSNNIKLIIKKNTFNPDEFFVKGMKKGGYSTLEGDDFRIALHTDEIINKSGFKNIKPREIPGLLAAKHVNISPFSSDYFVGFSGGGATADAKALFEMINLYFTQPNVDEKILENYKTGLRETLENNKINKKYNFMQDSMVAINNGNYRSTKLTAKDIELLEKDRVLNVYNKLFSGIDSYVFTISGDFDEKQIVKLASVYMGGITPKNIKSDYKDRNVRFKKNETGKNIILSGAGEVENRATVKILFEKDAEFSLEDSLKIALLKRITATRMRVRLREEKGGVYSISEYLRLKSYPTPRFSKTIGFTCDPGRVFEIVDASNKIIKEIHDKGVRKEELDNAKKQMMTLIKTSYKNNKFWVSSLCSYSLFEWPLDKFMQKHRMINALTLKDINEVAKKYFITNKGYTLIFAPETIKVPNE